MAFDLKFLCQLGIANLADVGTDRGLIIECSEDHAAGWAQVS
jgi:hypothetical protein